MKKTTGQYREITRHWRPATQAVRGGTWRSEHGETSEALFLSSGFTYDDAETVAARFAGVQDGMTYSRLQNPTVHSTGEKSKGGFASTRALRRTRSLRKRCSGRRSNIHSISPLTQPL